jgi:hypothetical protein
MGLKPHSPVVAALAQRHRSQTPVSGTARMISLCAPLLRCTKPEPLEFIHAIGDFPYE